MTITFYDIIPHAALILLPYVVLKLLLANLQLLQKFHHEIDPIGHIRIK